MNGNIENIVKIDTPSFQDMCKRIIQLEEENAQLKADNNVLGNELTYFKERCVDLEEEVNDLHSENVHFKAKNLALTKRLQNITLWDLSPKAQEEAGHQLARELLGGR